MNTITNKENDVSVYWLGGVGTKLSVGLTNDLLTDPNMPNVNQHYIDCSTSENALLGKDANISHATIRLDSNMAGSGGSRATNADAIMEKVPGIVDSKMNPSKINFCVFSGSGASGSTIAYALLKELVTTGKSVCCLISIDASNLSWANNARSALVSIDNLAREEGVIIPFLGYDATNVANYKDIDNAVIADMVMVSGMLEEKVIGLDDADRRNFLNPMKMPNNLSAPGLYGIELQSGDDIDSDSANNKVASLSLVEAGQRGHVDGCDINFGGLLSDSFRTSFLPKGVNRVSAVITHDLLRGFVGNLDQQILEFKRSAAIRTSKTSAPLSNDMDNKGGFIA